MTNIRMTLLLAIVSFIYLLPQAYTTHDSLPKNDLWREDYISKSNSGEEMFYNIIDTAWSIYKPIADEFGDSKLTINKKWNDPTVNANATRFFGKVTINMYGGLFRRGETTIEGFTLVLCHELSHAYGGYPYIRKWQKISAEGQADYAGAKDCLHKVIKALDLKNYEKDPTDYMMDTCEEYFDKVSRRESCVRSLVGGQSLAVLLATIKNEAVPSYDTPDLTEVEDTLLSYPKTTQCRLDTYLQGTLQLERPKCWFKKEEVE